MACGTPVLAFRCGSIPEVIEDGITGKVVDSEEAAVAGLPEILSYDRRAVRQRFDERFTDARMAGDYLGVYRRLLNTHKSPWRNKHPFNVENDTLLDSVESPFRFH